MIIGCVSLDKQDPTEVLLQNGLNNSVDSMVSSGFASYTIPSVVVSGLLLGGYKLVKALRRSHTTEEVICDNNNELSSVTNCNAAIPIVRVSNLTANNDKEML